MSVVPAKRYNLLSSDGGTFLKSSGPQGPSWGKVKGRGSRMLRPTGGSSSSVNNYSPTGWVTARWEMRASLPVRTPPTLPMTSLTIATLNIRGCRMALRRSQVLSFLREGGYSVVFLQETHTDPTAKDS
ncbi:unnamed protein product [Caretta caretta]